MWKTFAVAMALAGLMHAGGIVYEDAESGDTAKWKVLDDTPPGASIKRVYDEELQSNVIELKGDGEQNSFLLTKEDGSLWNDKDHFILEWKQKSDSSFVIYVMTKTTDGNRYITFCNCPEDRKVIRFSELSFGLGTDADDGRWHTFKVNLEDKLHELMPNTDLLSVEGLIVRGSGRFDDIILSDGKEEPEVTIPESPGNLQVSNSTPNSVTLTWEDLSDDEEGFKILRDGELIATLEENATEYTDTNLTQDTLYTYEIKAFNEAGESEGVSIEVQTPKEVTIPSEPINLEAAEVNASSVTIKWEDTSDDESGFEIYRNDLLIATVPANTTTYTDNNVSGGEEYLYTVKAVNEAGKSEGVSLSVQVPEEISIPKAPSDLNATEITSDSVTLKWSDNSDDETGFKILRDGEVIATLDENTTEYTDENLSSNTTYTYIVVAINEGGESESDPISVTTKEKIVELSAPANLTFANITPHSVTLIWEDTSDNETGFKILRDGELIATVDENVTEYTDDNLTAAKEYEYQVIATNGEVDSPAVSAKVKTDSGVPGEVTGLKAKSEGYESVILTWNDLPDETGFKILRDGEVIATLDENTTEYTDENLSPDTEYEYEVVAFNDYGDSKPAKIKIKTGEDPAMTYVRYLYNTVLDREPEEEGLKYWTKRLKNGDSAAAVAKGFFVLTHELQNKNLSNEEYVKKIYVTLYQREPLPGELAYWSKILNEGILNRDLVFDKLVYTNEFIKLAKSYDLKPFDENDMLYSRIESLYYLILGRKGSYGEIEYWVEKLKNNETTYEQVIKDFFFSKEFKERNLSDEDFVKAAYRTILNREPEKMGLEYWTKRLQEDLTREKLIDYIFNSPEYKFISDIKA